MIPLLAYLEDIRKTLNADLTVAGLETMKDISGNAITNAQKVQIALAQLSDQLADSGRECHRA